MARAKYKTLTEQMFYILICLKKECCGIDIMEMVADMTDGRVVLGPGTLYTLLGDFVKQGFIRETAVEGRTYPQAYLATTPWGGRIAAFIPGHKPECTRNPDLIANVTELIQWLKSK